jgi:hypothetical protein
MRALRPKSMLFRLKRYSKHPAQAVDLGADRALYEHAIAISHRPPPLCFPFCTAAFQWPPIAIPVSLPSDLLERDRTMPRE